MTTILTDKAIKFLIDLHTRFNMEIQDLLERRKLILSKLETADLNNAIMEWDRRELEIGEEHWRVRHIPKELRCRCIEITGPATAKIIINAMQCGADCFMADFEDSLTPTHENIIQGHKALYYAVRGKLTYHNPAKGKNYSLDMDTTTTTLLVRPRGFHLHETALLIDGEPISASLFDLGLHLFHNTQPLLNRGCGIHFYFPKLENRLEAQLLADIFAYSEEMLCLPKNTITVTVLIEHILASLEMEQILYELRNYCVALNCGRWDYIFSIMKTFGKRKEFLLPDRNELTMNIRCMRKYVKRLVHVCHYRGAMAIGGMAAQIPVKENPILNEKHMKKVFQDKLIEVQLGMDGTWIAHPGLYKSAKAAFDFYMKGDNQLEICPPCSVCSSDLLNVPNLKDHSVDIECVRRNIEVCLRYMETWMTGVGCVAIHHKMEDLATAEISRSQLWQFIYHKVETNVNRSLIITSSLILSIMNEYSSDTQIKETLLNIINNIHPEPCMIREFYPLVAGDISIRTFSNNNEHLSAL